MYAQYVTPGRVTFGGGAEINTSLISAGFRVDGAIDVPTETFFVEGKVSAGELSDPGAADDPNTPANEAAAAAEEGDRRRQRHRLLDRAARLHRGRRRQVQLRLRLPPALGRGQRRQSPTGPSSRAARARPGTSSRRASRRGVAPRVGEPGAARLPRRARGAVREPEDRGPWRAASRGPRAGRAQRDDARRRARAHRRPRLRGAPGREPHLRPDLQAQAGALDGHRPNPARRSPGSCGPTASRSPRSARA